MTTRAPAHAQEEKAIFDAFLTAHPSLFLFAHLRARFGPGVRPANGPKAGRRPESQPT
jgi:hypothetical protein